MQLVFSEYGWPETIISDNGPCYSVETFTKLIKDYSINHITISPHYLQSNGLAEKYIQIVKNLFYKVQEEGTRLCKSLMIYWNIYCQALYNYLCRFYNLKLPGHNSLCPMQPENCLDWAQNNLDWKTRMNSYHAWPTPGSKCHVPRFCDQKMLSSHNYQHMPRAQKLQGNNKRWYHIQKDTSPPKTILTTVQGHSK